MTAKCKVILSRVLLDLHANRFSFPGNLHGLPVFLDSCNTPNLQIVLLGDADWRAHAYLASQNLDRADNRVLSGEDVVLVDLEDDREDGLRARTGLLGLLVLLHVSSELVEEVVDDVGGENLNAVGLGLLHRLPIDLDIEAQHDSVLRMLLLLHDHRLLHVLLEDLADAHVEDRDLHVLQEAQEGLQRAQRAGLDVHALGLLLKAVEDAVELVVHVVLQLLQVVVGAHHLELGAGNRLVQAGGADLDAHGLVDHGMVDVLVLDPHLLHRLRREEGADGSHNGPIHSSEHYLVALAERAVDQDYIDSGAQPLDGLHLDDRALQFLLDFQLGGHQRLGQVEEHVE
mmetsp:Transcript_20966/g.54945  ORF Transcript_20966/g.54945 Transcript_20966/m.54945 type:complete len:343 (+) Transcript_20966:354-1382(+)